MAQVLNFHDAVMYDADVVLFEKGCWLNDNCINWYFRVLEHEVFPENPELLFMDPAVVSCMKNQCDDPDEFAELGRGIRLEQRAVTFIPVNDSAHLLASGSHWSLLICERIFDGRVSFRHYDSSMGTNRTAAENTALHFTRMFNESGDGISPQVEHVRDAPQQLNSYDCGMYTVLLAERLASAAIKSRKSEDHSETAGDMLALVASPKDIEPNVVSHARVLARERLSQCIRQHGARV